MNFLKRLRLSLLGTVVTVTLINPLSAQNNSDTLTEALKRKILGNLNNFTFGLYIDAYYNWTLDNGEDTSNLVPFSANCPVNDQIRLNVAALEFYYNAEKVRAKLAIQFGDQPNLLTAPEAQFIKILRQANFGFRIVEDLWIDIGYLFNPIGYESTWSVINQISTVTIGGYYEPASLLGAKLSYKFSPKFSGGFMIGNPFSLAYSNNTRMAGIIFLKYQPVDNFSLTNNTIFGNRSLYGSDLQHTHVTNNVILNYRPIDKLGLIGQLDVGLQAHSHLPPDSNKTATYISGFIQAHYQFNDFFSAAARFEYFDDPNGFLSGTYEYEYKQTGLATLGYTISLEYKPVSFGYFRISYRYLQANKGNDVFYGGTSDRMHDIIFTTGVRF